MFYPDLEPFYPPIHGGVFQKLCWDPVQLAIPPRFPFATCIRCF